MTNVWSEISEPNSNRSYTHCYLETPVGKIFIEWKSWKSNDSYSITNDSTNDYIGEGDSLGESKYKVQSYLKDMEEKLIEFNKNGNN